MYKSILSTLIVAFCIPFLCSALTAPVRRDIISNQHVNAFAQDSLGYMWVATANGLCKSDGKEYEIFFYDEKDPHTISSNTINGLFVDSRKRLWIATGSGVCRMSGDTYSFQRFLIPSLAIDAYCLGVLEYNKKIYAYGYNGFYEVNESNKTLVSRLRLNGQVISSVAVDANDNLWMSNGHELLKMNKNMGLTTKIKIAEWNSLNCMTLVGSELLLGTDNGLMRLDTRSLKMSTDGFPAFFGKLKIQQITPIEGKRLLIDTRNMGVYLYDMTANALMPAREAGIFEDVRSNEITTSFVDKDKNIWLGTFDRGLYLQSNRREIFNKDKFLVNFMRNKFVTRVIGDKSGNMWIGTRYNGLYCYNPATKDIKTYNSITFPPFLAFNSDFVQEIYCDSGNRLWICYGNSLMVCSVGRTGGLSIEKRYENIGNIVTIAEDAEGRIWAGSSSRGMYIFNPDFTQLQHSTSTIANSNNVTKIIPYDAGRMLCSAFMDNIYLVDIHTFAVSALNSNYQNQWKNAVALTRGRDNSLWIGTYGSGLLHYDPATAKLSKFTIADGLLSNDIIGMEEDKFHNVWASSSYGLYRINPASRGVNTYLQYDGTGGNQYHEKCAYKSSNGCIYFGGNNGLEEIYPENVAYKHRKMPIYLTDLKVFNKSVVPGDESGLLEKDISLTRKIELDYDQNVISLDYIALSYDHPEHISYAYRLKGFDKDWNYVGKYNRATYSNLPSGEYEFEIKIQNEDGSWSEGEKTVEITVNPAPWLHPIAILAYMVLALFLFYYISRLYLRLKLNKERYAMAEAQIEHEKSMTQMKVNFFTNISHELRTPLTLIYGPVQMLKKEHLRMDEQKITSNLDFIGKNVERLLNLLNQLLDFRKIQDETLPLKAGKYDCVQQMLNIVRIYKIYASEKNLNVDLECAYDKLRAVYDSDKLDKIMNNLLFNATKYTPDGGSIKVKMELSKQPAMAGDTASRNDWNYLKVSVCDNGIGVSKSGISQMFDRFKRMVSGTDKENEKGFGVGLNFVKHLVANQKGYITATKNEDKGMTFTFWLPIDESAYQEDERVMESEATAEKPQPAVEEPALPAETAQEGMELPAEDVLHKILVVEDNEDMRTFISSLFGTKYEVIQAQDGLEGFQCAVDVCPDLIVSDVLMPRMNGYEMCAKVKADKSVCHIPIILLTAKTMDDDAIKGYDLGADMYLNKPFNPEVLKSIVNNQMQKIEQRRKELMRLPGEQAEESPAQEELSPLDKRFMEKLYKYIDENISNFELNVGILGSELGFSRTNFYRKIKALTGVTPNDFLRVYRLNRAAELIKKREYTLNEISEMAGFGTQSHFSSSFKKHFGVSPKDYLSNIK